MYPYVKPSLHTSLIVEAHCLVGHSGVQKKMAYLTSRYYWEAMNADVLEVIHSCIECAKEKPKKGKIHYKPILPKFAFHTVSIDVVGTFQESSSGSLPVARATADVTAKFLLQKIIYQFGCPQTFLTDNGTNFTAKIIPILNHKMGIGTSLTTPYHLEANGIVERANSTIVRILRKLVE